MSALARPDLLSVLICGTQNWPPSAPSHEQTHLRDTPRAPVSHTLSYVALGMPSPLGGMSWNLFF